LLSPTPRINEEAPTSFNIEKNLFGIEESELIVFALNQRLTVSG
jgi:hypothetical protein